MSKKTSNPLPKQIDKRAINDRPRPKDGRATDGKAGVNPLPRETKPAPPPPPPKPSKKED